MIMTCSPNSAVTRPPRPRARRLAGVLAALLALPVMAVGSRTASAAVNSMAAPAQGAKSAPERGTNNEPLPNVTIQAAKVLRDKVHTFVTAVVAPPETHESLLRWNKPICPLVVGLPRDWGELILAQISQAARDARAPLAGRHCEPNLFVVVSAQPHQILKEWMANNPKVNTRHGLEPLKDFLDSTQPIRTWYNPEPSCEGGATQPHSAAASSSLGLPYSTAIGGVGAGTSNPANSMGPTYCDNSIDTHLTYGDVRSISYAIVVVDTNQLSRYHVKLGQLAAYASLVGLVDIRSDADGGGAPTILRLFHDPNPPDALTPWDRALLYSLYNTSQAGILQLTDMEISMVEKIAR